MLAQFLERQSSGMLALTTVRAVVVRIVNVREGCGLELGIFHAPTLRPAGCGLPMYNSYSLGTNRVLYKVIVDHNCTLLPATFAKETVKISWVVMDNIG
jgi:hypothetical protein